MTPEQEADLFTALGRIENKIDNCVETLTTHTLQDADNFTKLETQIEDIRTRQIREVENKIEALNILAAQKKGADEEAAKHASSAGGKMGGVVSLVVSAVVAGLNAYFSR